MRVVNLPPGCQGLRLEDGTHYRAAREGGRITVSDDHAKAIDAIPGNGTAGLVSSGRRGLRYGREEERPLVHDLPAGEAVAAVEHGLSPLRGGYRA